MYEFRAWDLVNGLLGDLNDEVPPGVPTGSSVGWWEMRDLIDPAQKKRQEKDTIKCIIEKITEIIKSLLKCYPIYDDDYRPGNTKLALGDAKVLFGELNEHLADSEYRTDPPTGGKVGCIRVRQFNQAIPSQHHYGSEAAKPLAFPPHPDRGWKRQKCTYKELGDVFSIAEIQALHLLGLDIFDYPEEYRAHIMKFHYFKVSIRTLWRSARDTLVPRFIVTYHEIPDVEIPLEIQSFPNLQPGNAVITPREERHLATGS